ncbi:acetyltransferase [Leptospira biflexa serovar Patoc strain 'Patoc 1 (Ames)']|uniref:N-acetyltransferase domain-containing protein n=1 Tax=Leptospira biflexa serovar Patoc (strain Patoc 1 / ATCC 23582 / Paris) TaxID=456481 RepID=B0SSP2_LEPBP|nr:GNAT family N-acetyltransferase [Leptospira biflexa]ABZ94477.1 acetyltransferase [Leptospira biflexa serovar Patoc strain 'Patoc 1 (Ames)']ABZ98132.1 Hypothetical protein LEPBI_I2030 [Leptospira biflexa serovar Patoc strain 'Patoc 1 (Paris)']
MEIFLNLIVRPAIEDDCKLIFEWANEPEVRNASFHSKKIEWSEHKNWFSEKLQNPDSIIYIFEVDGEAAGQIRFDKNGEFFEIDYSIDKKYRGNGFGNAIVRLGITNLKSQFKESIRVVARVKEGNLISAKVFQNIGFKETKLGNGDLQFVYE